MRLRPAKILQGVGLLAIVGLMVCCIYAAVMIKHGFSARDEPSGMEAALAKRMRRWAIPGRGSSLKNPVQPSAEVLSEARAHWADHCALCHANDGSGQTEIGRHLYPRAPDMRAAQTQGLSDGELYWIIENGIRLSGMPAWSDKPTDDDRESWALVAFIRHLPQLSPGEQEEMKRLNPKPAEELAASCPEDEEARFLNEEHQEAQAPKMRGGH